MSFRSSQPEQISALNRFFSNLLLLLSIWLVTVIMSGCGVPATDLPASDLDVVARVLDTDPNPYDGKVAVLMQFFHEGKQVSPGDAAHITCNGVRLFESGEGHTARVPLVPQGGSYLFRHQQENHLVEALIGTKAPAMAVSMVRNGGPEEGISYLKDPHSGGRGFRSFQSEYAMHMAPAPASPAPKEKHYSRYLAQEAGNARP